MVRILQINTSIVRSTGTIAQAIGDMILEEGWESYLAYSARTERHDSKSKLIPIGSKRDAQIHAISTRLFDNHGFCSSKATRKLIENIKEIDPDIIHLHNIHGYYLNLDILFRYLSGSGKPIVWTLHDCWPMTGHCSHFDAIGCMKWKTGCYRCALKTEYPSSILIDNSKRNWKRKKHLFNLIDYLTIVPVSSWMESIVKESYLKKYPTHVIHNGIDLEVFNINSSNTIRERHHIGDRTIALGVATGWYEGGGLRRFNEFMKLSNLLDDQYRIVLIGLEGHQLADLPSNVIGIRRTANQKELAEYYAAADVFINPTYQDSLPTVNMEALACGTPVITYKTGGSTEIIDSSTGWVVNKGDVKALAFHVKQIRELSEDMKNSQRILCRKRAELHFNKIERYKDYINLYKQILHL